MYEQQIQRGMDLLDAQRPGWDARIDLTKLELSSCTQCVLGQLAGTGKALDFYNLAHELGAVHTSWGNQFSPGLVLPEAAEYGFALSDAVLDSPQWGVLTDEWREAIARRRLAGLTPPTATHTQEPQYAEA